MPATIDDVKRAFSGKVATPQAIIAGAKDEMSVVVSLFNQLKKAGEPSDRQRSDMSTLSKSYIAAGIDALANSSLLGAVGDRAFAEAKRIYEAARTMAAEFREALKRIPEFAKARKDALAMLDECLIIARSYKSLNGDRADLQQRRSAMDGAAAKGDLAAAIPLAAELKTKSIDYLKKCIAEQKQYDKLGEDILKSIKDASYFKEDNVTRDWIKKLSPEQIKFLPTKIRNRMMEELHEGVFSGDDKDAMKKLYSVRCLDAAFEKAEKKKQDAYIEKLQNDPEIKKARKDWATMDSDQKMKVLEKVANFHAESYGTKSGKGVKPLKVKAYNKEPKKDAAGKVKSWNNGVYNHSSGTITVNTNSYPEVKFNNFDKALDLMTHEAGHRYQETLAGRVENGELKPGDPEYDQAVAFMWNDKYYVEEPWEVYQNQPMETHSRVSGAAIDAANIGGST